MRAGYYDKRIDVFETWGPEEWHSEKGGYHTDVQAAVGREHRAESQGL